MQDSWKATRKLTAGVRCSFHPLPAVGRRSRASAIRSSTQPSSPRLRVFADVTAGSSGMPKTAPFQWEDSRPERCSINPGSGPRTTFPERLHGCPRRLGPLLLPFWPVHERPGRICRGSDRPICRRATGSGSTGCPTNPSTGSALFTAYLSCMNLASTPASPAAVDSTDNNQPYTDGWSVNVDQQTPWQGLFELVLCRQPEQGPAEYRGWRRQQHQPGSLRLHALGHQSGDCECQPLSPVAGIWRPQSSHQQPLQQLQRPAGQLGPPCRACMPFRPTTHSRRLWGSLHLLSTPSASRRTTARWPRTAEICSTQPTRLTSASGSIQTPW